MKWIHKFAIFAITFLPMLFPTLAHAQAKELSCPIGQFGFPGHTTVNGATGKYREWLCYDYNGNVYGTFFGGTLSPSSLDGIRFADKFSGSDWCAKVNSADLDIGSATGTIFISNSLAGVSCSTALSFTAARRIWFDCG